MLWQFIFGNRPLCPYWPGIKKGQAGTKQRKQGQNRINQIQNRHSHAQSMENKSLQLALFVSVLSLHGLSLFCPCWPDLAYLSLFCPCSIFAVIVPVLSLIVLPLFVRDLSLLVCLYVCMLICLYILVIKKIIIFILALSKVYLHLIQSCKKIPK